MKRTALVASYCLAFFGSLAFGSVPLACLSNNNAGSSSDDAGTLPPEDSGSPPRQDATVPGVDSGASDAGIDAAESIDAGPGPVTLTVLLGSVPESNVLVVFEDATGAVVASATTSPSGSVSEDVSPGGMATVVLGTPLYPQLVTITDVQPGDVINVIDGTGNPTSLYPQYDVALPTGDWDASTVGVEEYAGTCEQGGGFSLQLNPDCYANNAFPVLAIATDNTTDDEVAYTYQTTNPIVPDGGLPTDGAVPELAIDRPWSTSSVMQTITVTAVPDGGPDNAISASTAYMEVSGGIPSSAPEQGLTGSGPYVVHTGFPDFVQTEAFGQFGGVESYVGYIGSFTRSDTPTSSQTASVDLTTLPLFDSVGLDSTDAGTSAQPVVSWSTASPATNAVAVISFIEWYGLSPDGGPQSVQGGWLFVTPGSATSVQGPQVPASVASFLPTSQSSFSLPTAAAFQTSLAPTYGAFKTQFSSLSIFTSFGSGSPPVLPANGTLLVSALSPEQG